MTEHLKTIEQTFRVLDDIEHVRVRPSTYAGSPVEMTANEFVFDMTQKKMVKRQISYIPAMVKGVSEAIDNCVDEHKRNPGKLDKIRLSYDMTSGEIVIEDNGGIPVVIHQEHQKYVPEIIFGQLRSGSNYNDDDDQSLIGTNGLGVKLLNIFSTDFIVETADGKNSFKQEFTKGMRERSEPKIKSSTSNFTRITFMLDYEYFKKPGLDQDYIDKIIKRLVDVAGNNPGLKVYVNGERIMIHTFKDYVELYTTDAIHEGNDDWKVSVAALLPGEDGFQQVSFVNSVETYEGGTHVNYVVDQITTKLRELFKKKHKVDVKPADIRNQMTLFITANINRPKFNSQVKSHMISEYKDFKTSFEVTDKFARKIMDSPIVQSVLDWVLAKEDAARRAELRKLNKDTDKVNPRSIEKLNDASKKGDRSECMIFLSEGDSAATAIKSAGKAYKDPTLIGSYPLRGKPLNVCGIDTKRLVANQVFSDMMVAIGLKMGEKVETVEDGKWVTLDVNGEIMTVNENDFLFVDGAEYRVKDLVK